VCRESRQLARALFIQLRQAHHAWIRQWPDPAPRVMAESTEGHQVVPMLLGTIRGMVERRPAKCRRVERTTPQPNLGRVCYTACELWNTALDITLAGVEVGGGIGAIVAVKCIIALATDSVSCRCCPLSLSLPSGA
jgi:hypothetical protein